MSLAALAAQLRELEARIDVAIYWAKEMDDGCTLRDMKVLKHAAHRCVELCQDVIDATPNVMDASE